MRSAHWCDGSDAEIRELASKMVRDGELWMDPTLAHAKMRDLFRA
jgi:GTP-dependent phosphoenolpyruvate carboxykinase